MYGNVEYTLKTDGKTLKGSTDGAGLIDKEIPKDAESAVVAIASRGATLEFEIDLSENLGAGDEEMQRQLANLDFYAGGIDGNLGEISVKAVREFQSLFGLKVDGVAGDETKERIKKQIEGGQAKIAV